MAETNIIGGRSVLEPAILRESSGEWVEFYLYVQGRIASMACRDGEELLCAGKAGSEMGCAEEKAYGLYLEIP